MWKTVKQKVRVFWKSQTDADKWRAIAILLFCIVVAMILF